MPNHVGAYVDRCRELGVNPPKRVIGHLAKEIGKLTAEGQPDAHVALAVRLLAEKGSQPAQLPYLLVEAVRRVDRAAISEFVREHGWPTGCKFVRGTHSGTHLYDPLGTDRPPEGWIFGRPDRQEVEPLVKALGAIGGFLCAA